MLGTLFGCSCFLIYHPLEAVCCNIVLDAAGAFMPVVDRIRFPIRAVAVGVSGRNGFPNCGYGSVSGNGDLVANCLFVTVNAPSLELLAIGSSEAVLRERIFAGNSGYICHCARTAVSRKGHCVGQDRRQIEG